MPAASSGVYYFLRIDDPHIPGSCKEQGHDDGWIQIESWDASFSNSVDVTKSTEGTSGVCQASPFSAMKNRDKASPLIAKQVLLGGRVGKVTVEGVRTGQDATEKPIFMRWIFQNCVLTGYHCSMSDAASPEPISFSYANVDFEYKELDAAGVLGSPIGAKFNVKEQTGEGR